jgi:hypothetical protein
MGAISTVTLTIAALAAFFIFLTAVKYAVDDDFDRTRLIMTSFFVFIIFTLTLAFWPYRYSSLPYAVPALFVGVGLGYFVAVRAAKERLMMEGITHYIEHATHVHLKDVRALRWWSLINFYSVMGALLIINLVGLSMVWFRGNDTLAIATCVFGAFGVGTLAPYLYHLWGLKRNSQ